MEVAEFSLKGRAMRNVRQMVNRVERSGYTAQVRRVRDIPREEIAAFRRVAGTWRGNPTERGFSMALGRMGAPGDEDCVIATAHENGVLRGILHFVPWGPDGLSLDLMRRDRSAQPGVNDFLIVAALNAAGELGVKRLSLNFAVFRSALERGERIGAGPVMRAWRGILLFASRWFQIESLYKFNAKFAPEWVPRFFVWPGTRDTPRVALAALEAEAFLVWPKLEVRRLARRLGLGKARRRLMYGSAHPTAPASPVPAAGPARTAAGPGPAGGPADAARAAEPDGPSPDGPSLMALALTHGRTDRRPRSVRLSPAPPKTARLRSARLTSVPLTSVRLRSARLRSAPGSSAPPTKPGPLSASGDLSRGWCVQRVVGPASGASDP